MKKFFALTLLALLTVTCHNPSGYQSSSKGATMTYSVQTQAELDEANQRINAFKQELLQQGFRQVSVSFSNSADIIVLEGKHGRLNDLRVTLKTNKQLQDAKPQLSGGIHASIEDAEADKEFDALYNRVVLIVTGHPL